MVINEKGLCAAMKDAFKKRSTGYKVAAQITEAGEKQIILAAPGWTAIIARENAPRKVMGLIVEYLGDLPKDGDAYQVQDKQTQAEIFDMAVPDTPNPVAGAEVKRTNLAYMGYQIWQRTDNHSVYMVAPAMEDLLDSFGVPIVLTDNGMLYAEGLASQLYILPLQVMQNELTALNHLAKLQWV